MNKRWEVQKLDHTNSQKLAKDLNVNEVISKLLIIRGIKTFSEAKQFFRPDLSDLHDPFLMKNMHKAVERIEVAIKNNQKVLIYGDYDVDGTTAVAMMFSFMKKYNQSVEYYIPCRYEEGYGISYKGIDYADENNFSLIISLDCGIRAISQIDYANERGVDFIICDHHNPSDNIPKAIAVLNPKQSDCTYPYKHLSGCGVGFKLIQAYSIKNNIPFTDLIEYLDLLTVSIAADIVPVTGENRILSFYGLKQINLLPRPGLRVLMDAASKTKEIIMSDLVFGIAPRINAAGRIKHARKAVEILTEVDYNRARMFAKGIEENNIKRKDLDASITAEALQMVDKNKKSTVVFSKKWHKGIVGIVASRLIESYYKPTIVLAENNGLLTGSARSVHDFDVYGAISQCSNLCEKFGGHKYAAGLSIKKENLQAFINKFEMVVSEKINKDQLSPKIIADMEINICEIDNKLFRIIKQFSPFGPLNPPPVFISKKVTDSGYAKRLGAAKTHLSVNIKTNNGSIPGIGFSMGSFFDNLKHFKEFDLCYSLSENVWNGKKTLQLMIADIKTS